MHLYLRICLALPAYALFLLLLRLLRPLPLIRRLTLPLAFLGLAATLRLFLDDLLVRLHPQAPRLLSAAAVFLALYLTLRLLEVALFDRLIARRARRPVPVVLRDILHALLSALLFAWIVKAFFPAVNFNVLAVSSIVVGYILGNATQDTLGNLVAGLALNSEDCFSIGDWITVQNRTGRIADVTWRSTRILTRDREDVIIPNATLSREIIVNHSRPTPELRTRLRIGVSYEAPPNRVREVLLDALRDTPGVETDPAPRVRLVDYGDFAISYDVLFFIRDFAELEETRAAFMNRVWYRFKRAGITIPFPIRDVRERRITREDDQAEERRRLRETAVLFGRAELFAGLSEPERFALAAGANLRLFADGEAIVRQGDAGDSLFLVRSGRAEAVLEQADGSRLTLGRIGPGEFFGERSLLTGAPRSATVSAAGDVELVELDKAAFGPVLQAKPEIAEQLGRLLAAHEQGRVAAAGAAAHDRPPPDPGKSRQFMMRIRHFFGIS